MRDDCFEGSLEDLWICYATAASFCSLSAEQMAEIPVLQPYPGELSHIMLNPERTRNSKQTPGAECKAGAKPPEVVASAV